MEKKNPRWKEFEKLILLLEKFSNPNYYVEFDKRIKDVDTGQFRQVDICITDNNGA